MSDTATMYRNMDVKTINIKIKYGATMEELLEYFNCSEEQFEGYVKRNFGEKGKRDIYANLEKNKKKREKKKKGLRAGVNNAKQQILIPKKVLFDDQVKRKTLTDLLEEDKVIDLPIVEQDRKMPENLTKRNEEKIFTAEQQIIQKENLAKEESKDENMKLQELQDRERILVDKICEEEKELVSVRAQKRDIKARLNDEKQYMIELKKIIAEHQDTIEGIMKEISEVSEKHDQVKAEIVSNSEELERVRMDIDKLKKVDILFYKNGLFELENFKYEDIPEMQLDQNIFNSLCEDETAEELSIKVIKQIVRLEQILQWFSTNQLSYEITFEAEEMQKVFEKIHKI